MIGSTAPKLPDSLPPRPVTEVEQKAINAVCPSLLRGVSAETLNAIFIAEADDLYHDLCAKLTAKQCVEFLQSLTRVMLHKMLETQPYLLRGYPRSFCLRPSLC